MVKKNHVCCNSDKVNQILINDPEAMNQLRSQVLSPQYSIESRHLPAAQLCNRIIEEEPLLQ